MCRKSLAGFLPILCLGALCTPRIAAAQFAVIDVASIAQLIQQYQVMAQQLSTVQKSLQQAQQEYGALTGDRGMQNLLAGTLRNYLPTDWSDFAAAMQGSGSAAGLANSIQAIVAADSVLTATDVGRFSTEEIAQLTAARQSVALLQALSRDAVSTTSARFASLQHLIDAIPGASDPKAALDLQARIASEQSMLANDASKLQALYEAARAEQLAVQQRQQEQGIQDIGSLRTLAPMGLPH